VATYATDLQTVNLCDSDTDWTELSGHQSGGAPADDTENFIHNDTSISQSTGQATGTNAGMQYDYGSNISWTSGDIFLVWQFYAAPTNLQPWASGGMRFCVGSSSGNVRFWNALGDNFGNYPYGGWQNTAIDPEVTGDGSDDGSPTTGNYRIFGSLPNVRAKITKGTPHAVDAIRYGRGELQVTGTSATFSGMATANDADTARWGLFQASGGGYLWKGLMSLGLSGTSATFSDSNKAIRIDDTPRVVAGFNKIEINNSSTSVTWTGVSISGVQTSINGSAPVSKGDFEAVDDATVDINSCTFTDMGTFVFQSNSDVDDSVFRRCEQVTQGSATFDNCIFDNPTGTVALSANAIGSVSGCTFNSDGTGHAVNLGTISSTQAVDWENTESGYASSDGSTGNETILVSVGSGYTLTINVATGASTPTIYNTGSGNVSVVAGTVSTTVTVKDAITKSVIQGVAVTITAATTGPLPFEDSVTISRVTTTATVSHTTHGLSTGQKVKIAGAVQNEYNRIKEITRIDNDSYSYTVTGSPTAPATGTITATAIVIDGLTDASGQISDSRTLDSDQDITGIVQKGSTAPVYKPQDISTTIDSSNGVSISLLLIAD